jgi:hypothetical protein
VDEVVVIVEVEVVVIVEVEVVVIVEVKVVDVVVELAQISETFTP